MSKPHWRERLKPVELLVLSAVLGLFAGLVVFMSTRDLILGLIFLGLAFIVSLVVLAMLALAVEPNLEEKLDLREQNEQEDRGH
jgi:predicted lysophospholipase L1 biosynthesis ABC-type transport system permease subunit